MRDQFICVSEEYPRGISGPDLPHPIEIIIIPDKNFTCIFNTDYEYISNIRQYSI